MTQLPITTEASEPRSGYVLDIFNPKVHLGECVAPRVALLKAIFGIDDTGQLTKPAPPKDFAQKVFEYIMFDRVLERRTNAAHKPRKPTLASLLKQAAKAGTAVKGAEVYKDRIVLQFGEPERAEPENPWPLDEFRTKETKQ